MPPLYSLNYWTTSFNEADGQGRRKSDTQVLLFRLQLASMRPTAKAAGNHGRQRGGEAVERASMRPTAKAAGNALAGIAHTTCSGPLQ